MQQTPKPAPRSTNRAAAPAPRAPRRPLSEAQVKVLPLQPIFKACQARGLKVTPENKEARLRAFNSYVLDLPIDWIETSFKELLGNPFAIFVIADAIEGGALTW